MARKIQRLASGMASLMNSCDMYALEQPYVMLRNTGNFSGNERYEGFCIDLLREIARMVGFTYKIELVPDGKYGVYDYETGEWNGIVRQLMDKSERELPSIQISDRLSNQSTPYFTNTEYNVNGCDALPPRAWMLLQCK
ncbi:hypothetical protein KQX54_018896 [Cotesia glomerata]|uniref:Ionotropic glutamate receptor L-glutamate and glycine-binding domain-containing protein n=1 Tax=Cotesia glomerata TaxID=32391 RepID=A0AAV7J598_COTGL|nr:hypothetical protein KQX54_018896 [Cotesia glomerata]